MEDEKLTVKDIAFKEAVSQQTVYRWVAEGYIEYEKRPGKNGGIVITMQAYRRFKSECAVRQINE